MLRLEGADLPQYFIVRWFFTYHRQLSASEDQDRFEKALKEKFALAPDSPAAATLLAEAAIVGPVLDAVGRGRPAFATAEEYERYQVDRLFAHAAQIGESFGRFLRDLRAEGRSVTEYEALLRRNFALEAVLHYTDPEDRALFIEVDRRFRQAVEQELGAPHLPD
jgi:hypothetical protein